MKKILSLFTLCIILLAVNSCSESTSPDENAKIKIVTHMSKLATIVSQSKSSEISVNEVDTIRIERVRFLMKEIKFFKSGQGDDVNSGVVKTGPFAANFEPYGDFTLANGSIPAGSYIKSKIEMHRFTPDELAQYSTDVFLNPFTIEERPTVIIEGKVKQNGQEENFKYLSKATINTTVTFATPYQFDAGKEYIFELSVDMNTLFTKNQELLDPRKPANENDIDNSIKNAIKFTKK